MDGAAAIYERLLESFTYLQPWRAGASDCTYCRRPGNKGRVCYSTFTSRLTCLDYDADFLERGFMRSGTSLYRPLNEVSCCPNLAIRLHALEFRPSKSQRSAMRRVLDSLCGRRAIALPAVVTDPFLRCVALAREGKAREAAEAVLRNRGERTQECRQTPRVLALARALGIKFLGEGGGGEVEEEEEEEEAMGVGPLQPLQPPRPQPLPQAVSLADPLLCQARGLAPGLACDPASLACLPAPTLRLAFAACLLQAALRSCLGPTAASPDVLARIRVSRLQPKAAAAAAAAALAAAAGPAAAAGGAPPPAPEATCNAAFVLAAEAGSAGAGARAAQLAQALAATAGALEAQRLPTPTPRVSATVSASGNVNLCIEGDVEAIVSCLASFPTCLSGFQAQCVSSSSGSGSGSSSSGSGSGSSSSSSSSSSSHAQPPTAPLTPEAILASGVIPLTLNSCTARTPAEWAALEDFYRRQQWEREVAGRALIAADPLWPTLGPDDDEAPSTHPPFAPLSPQECEKEEKELQEDLEKSVKALQGLLAMGVGSCAQALRTRAEVAASAAGAGAAAAVGEKREDSMAEEEEEEDSAAVPSPSLPLPSAAPLQLPLAPSLQALPPLPPSPSPPPPTPSLWLWPPPPHCHPHPPCLLPGGA